MKTKKEIKPFKMRCESQEVAVSVIEMLRDNGVNIMEVILSGETIVVLSIRNNAVTRWDVGVYFRDRTEPELTYSEFMKLYGEEEEVFTREDMEAAMTWVTSHFFYTIKCDDEVLTKYLSERAND